MLGWPKRHGLKERDMLQVKYDKARGILEPGLERGLMRFWPSDGLAPFVEHYWIVRWNLAETKIAETLPYPSMPIVLEEGRAHVVGVMRAKFSRVLKGRGRVVPTKFRPSG